MELDVQLDTTTPGVVANPFDLDPGRPSHAATSEGTVWSDGRSRMNSSTSTRSRFSTISTRLMSAPIPPKADATVPNAPGRFGSRTRTSSTPSPPGRLVDRASAQAAASAVGHGRWIVLQRQDEGDLGVAG